MKNLFLLLLILFSTLARAAVPNEIRRLFKPFVVTAPHAFHLFHYMPAEQALALPQGQVATQEQYASITANDRRVLDNLSYKKELFWNSKTSNGAAGDGLYFATDPVVTRSYGGKNFVLVQTVIDKGSLILDTVDSSGEQLLDINNFISKNSKSISLYDLWSDSSFEGLSLKREIIKTLGVVGFAYRYISSLSVIYYRECKDLSGMKFSRAIVIVDDQAIRPDRVSVFTSNIPQNESAGRTQNRLLIEDMSKFVSGITLENYKLKAASNPTSSIFPSLIDRSSDYSHKDWVKKAFYGCGEGWKKP